MDKNEKRKGIVYNGKSIFVAKDFLRFGSGILLVLISILISGASAFVSFDLDPSALLTSGFWLKYGINLAMIYACYFGVYIIRRNANMITAKIVIIKAELRERRTHIVSSKKINDFKEYLKIYNNEQKLKIYQESLINDLQRLSLVEPEEPVLSESAEPSARRRYKTALRKYQKALSVYKKEKSFEESINKQLEAVTIHGKIINELYSKNYEAAEKLRESLPKEDRFAHTRIEWRNVQYNDLFNFSAEQPKSNSIFVNEKHEIWGYVYPMLLSGLAITAFLSSAIFGPQETTILTIVAMLLNWCSLIWYAINGLSLADNIVFKSIYPAEQRKRDICDAFEETDKRTGGMWEDAQTETVTQ